MNDNNVNLTPNPMTPSEAVVIDEELCTGCNKCVEACKTQTLMPHPEKDKPPVVIYPDECWFGGCCVAECPEGAITIKHPMNQGIGVSWKDKDSGELFRLGMINPPPKTYNKPPLG